MAEELKRILIIKPSALGDLIQVLPVLSVLRKTYPDSEIYWMVRNEFASLIQNHPDLTDVILFDRKFLGKAWWNPKALGAIFKLISQLRKFKFDVVLDFQGLFRTAGLAFLSGSKRRFGPANAREFGHIFYTKKVKQDKSTIHLVDYYMEIAGIKSKEVKFKLPQNEKASESVKKLLSDSNISEKGYAVFVPGSAHADKCWPVDKFAELADKITQKYGCSIVVVGTKSESALAEEIQSKTQTPIINLAGKTDIPMLVEILRNAKLVISNDTGPGHIAAALNKPMVMIFGRSNPARVMPYRKPECVAAIEPMERGFKADSTNPRHNVNDISVEEVLKKICFQL
ncbi:MAG: lipopolysaccharide heptosyltransferase I [Sedimentisphaerales bacterium]|nr:lipopolysaccharide heptosyltransferase I [Sedimentisphaerales bacterium]